MAGRMNPPQEHEPLRILSYAAVLGLHGKTAKDRLVLDCSLDLSFEIDVDNRPSADNSREGINIEMRAWDRQGGGDDVQLELHCGVVLLLQEA